MSPKSFEVPFVVGGLKNYDFETPCTSGFTACCGTENSACGDNYIVDDDDGCGWSLFWGVIGVVIAAVPTNAVPG